MSKENAKKPAIAPIIIKRIKKNAAAHHGGAWKIAYADFVTAMMAFFLLMWLLGSSTSGDLKGIADYFNTPLKVAIGGGSGSGDSSSILKGGGKDLTRSTGQVRYGDVQSDKHSINLQALRADLERKEKGRLEELKRKMEGAIEANPKFADIRKQIRMEITPEGLVIQIVDEQNRPMFATGSSVVKDYMRDILRQIGQFLNGVDNRITLSGHTDATPYNAGERGYSNWELSADRANASRRELVAGGMDDGKVFRVVGLASSNLFNKDDPRDPTNRRIGIVVMNKQAEDRLTRGGGNIEAGDVEGAAEATVAETPPAGNEQPH
jgi:chemotaxis protein MotB